jgi:hypothetical protein
MLLKGQLEEAQLENVSADPSNLPDGRVFYNTTSKVAKVVLDTAAKQLSTIDGTETLTNKTIDADSNTITNIANDEIKAAAAIALNKLAAVTVSRALVSDGSGFVAPATTTATEIGYVNGVTSAIQTQLDEKALDSDLDTHTGATIAHGATGAVVGTTNSQILTNKTIDADSNTITNIENADIKAAAAIAHNKMAALTVSRAMVTDGSGFASASTATATELGYLSGVTSAIQTQINGVLSDPMTTRGDIVVRNSSNTTARLGVGAAGTAIRSNGTDPSWGYPSAVSKTTTYTAALADDTIFASTSGGAWTLALPTAVGCLGKVFTVIKTDTSTNMLEINPDSTETIFGRSSIYLSGQYDVVKFVSDNANWVPTTAFGHYRTCSVKIAGNGASSPTVSNEAGAWVSSTSRSNAGIYAVTIRTNIFSAAPSVQFNAVRNLDNDRYQVGAWMPTDPSSTSISIHLNYADDGGGSSTSNVRDDSNIVWITVWGPR